MYDNESCIAFSKYSLFIKTKQVKNLNYVKLVYLYIITFMDIIFILKVAIIIGFVVALFLIFRNIDVIKIIFNYWKNRLFRK
tara:strand:- start:187 stop:432 length:246 start_codon:yes stop_codon:yes gene_type:complete